MNEKMSDILAKVEKPARYVGGEYGEVIKDRSVPVRVAFCFPDTYEVGMSNIGMKILVGEMNALDFCWCERAYCPWPDMAQALRDNGLKLGTLESGDALCDFDIVAFTLQYEMCYTNVLEMLNLGGIPFKAADRTEKDPIVICGGPCAYNIEPIADIFDAVNVGEGEDMVPEFVSLYKEMKTAPKKEFLKQATKIGGVYVPAFYHFSYDAEGKIAALSHDDDVPSVIVKRIVKDLNKSYYPTDAPIASGEIIQDRDCVELFRGCIRGCRFCQAGHTFRPIRQKSPDTLVQQATACLMHSGAGELALSSLSTSDYSGLPELCDRLLPKLESQKINVSVPSLRADNFSTELSKRIAGVRKSSITFAPEAGSQRLRDVINKNLTEKEIINACKVMFESGWSRVKLYFMLGLPTENNEDIEQIAELADRIVHTWRTCDKDQSVQRQLSINLSTSLFVPKPFTPFQWERMCTIEELNDKIAVLKNKLKARAVSYAYHDSSVSKLEGVFARGDRKLCDVVIKAWENGCRFDAWDEHFSYEKWIAAFDFCGVDPAFYLRERGEDEILPWSHIDCGVTKEYFLRSRHDAYREVITPDCRSAPGKCSGCGAWKLLGKKCELDFGECMKELPAIGKPEQPEGEPESYRFGFVKTGKSVYTSHLELMKTFSMAFKRIGIMLKYSGGFSPKPYISIARPLSLGYASECEILDTSLYGKGIDRKTLIDRLNAALPGGLTVLYNEPSILPSDIAASLYRIEWRLSDLAVVPNVQSITEFLAGDVFVDKKSKKGVKQVNVKDHMYGYGVSVKQDQLILEIKLRDAVDGSLNPRVVIGALENRFVDIPKGVAKVTRVRFCSEAEVGKK